MTAAIPIPTRILALLGVAVIAFAAFLLFRPLLLSDGSESSSTPAPPASIAPTRPHAAAPTPATPAKPAIHLIQGLPAPIATKLRHSRVVVVSVYSGTSPSDRAALGAAKAGARESGAGFLAMNVLDEKRARQLQGFAGVVSAPTMLVVKRPGQIVTRLDGSPDSQLVAQAAHNAGAGRR